MVRGVITGKAGPSREQCFDELVNLFASIVTTAHIRDQADRESSFEPSEERLKFLGFELKEVTSIEVDVQARITVNHLNPRGTRLSGIGSGKKVRDIPFGTVCKVHKNRSHRFGLPNAPAFTGGAPDRSPRGRQLQRVGGRYASTPIDLLLVYVHGESAFQQKRANAWNEVRLIRYELKENVFVVTTLPQEQVGMLQQGEVLPRLEWIGEATKELRLGQARDEPEGRPEAEPEGIVHAFDLGRPSCGKTKAGFIFPVVEVAECNRLDLALVGKRVDLYPSGAIPNAVKNLGELRAASAPFDPDRLPTSNIAGAPWHWNSAFDGARPIKRRPIDPEPEKCGAVVSRHAMNHRRDRGRLRLRDWLQAGIGLTS